MAKSSDDELGMNLDRPTLTGIARRALDDSTAELIDWQHDPLQGGGSVVYRISGRARQCGREVPWSAILKKSRGAATMGDISGGIREPIVYASNFIPNLPCRLTTPQCLEITRRPDEPEWIWLEDIRGSDEGNWSLGRFAEAAFYLGQFNATTLEEEHRPDWSWLDSRISIREFVENFVVSSEEAAENMKFWEAYFGLDRIYRTRFLLLHEERETYLRYLEALPRCLGHGDADRRNFMFRRDADDEEEFIAIDWTLSGLSTLGDDSQNLVYGSMAWRQFDFTRIDELDEAVFAGYLRGLRSVDWDGDERVVRLGHACSSMLKWGLTILIRAMGWPQWREQSGSVMGYPVEEMVELMERLLGRLILHIDKADSLARQLSLSK